MGVLLTGATVTFLDAAFLQVEGTGKAGIVVQADINIADIPLADFIGVIILLPFTTSLLGGRADQ